MNNLVEYSGLADELPKKIKAYKQFIVKKKVRINESRIPMRDIIKILAVSEITNRRIVKNAKGVSLEGTALTGFKYMIKGFFDLKIYYEEWSDLGLLGVKSDDVKFYLGIDLENGFMISNNLITTIYIEDIYSELLNEREIFIAITAVAIVEGDEDYE